MNETNNSASMSGSWPNNMMSSGAMPSGDLPNNSGNWDEFAPPEERKKLAFDLWRSLPDVNNGIPEDLIADELCAASDANDLAPHSSKECWQRSRNPMPRLRIATELGERLFPWYSLTIIHVDKEFCLFELYFTGNMVCRVISRTPQPELYANLQLERVKVIQATDDVAVIFDTLQPINK